MFHFMFFAGERGGILTPDFQQKYFENPNN